MGLILVLSTGRVRCESLPGVVSGVLTFFFPMMGKMLDETDFDWRMR